MSIPVPLLLFFWAPSSTSSSQRCQVKRYEKAIKNYFFLNAFTLRETESTRQGAFKFDTRHQSELPQGWESLLGSLCASCVPVERSLASLQHLSEDQVWSSRQAGAHGRNAFDQVWSSRQAGTQKAGQKGADPKNRANKRKGAPIPRTGNLKLKN